MPKDYNTGAPKNEKKIKQPILSAKSQMYNDMPPIKAGDVVNYQPKS